MISQELFDELQLRYKLNNRRVEIFGVQEDGVLEFLHSVLSPKDAYKYCESHSRLHPDRFPVNGYVFGNLQQMEDGDYSAYRHVAKTDQEAP